MMMMMMMILTEGRSAADVPELISGISPALLLPDSHVNICVSSFPACRGAPVASIGAGAAYGHDRREAPSGDAGDASYLETRERGECDMWWLCRLQISVCLASYRRVNETLPLI
ncbi:hypothetical protein QQF64_005242 [Cirrhinus molitorella]|uniref:Uncharacterized protein n=1 Tax=Cirrhinus molitorella TaxID=172907 RepID=A0ABR3MIJ2_9TELE